MSIFEYSREGLENAETDTRIYITLFIFEIYSFFIDDYGDVTFRNCLQ